MKLPGGVTVTGTECLYNYKRVQSVKVDDDGYLIIKRKNVDDKGGDLGSTTTHIFHPRFWSMVEYNNTFEGK